MSTPLRPLTTAELLDRTFHLYRNNFILFAGIATIAAVTMVGALLLLTALGNPFASPTPVFDPKTIALDFGIYVGVLAIFYVLGASVASGATIYAVSKVHLGKPATISESYGKVLPRFGRILLLVLAIVIRIIGMLVFGYVCLFVLAFMLGLIFAGQASQGVVIFLNIVGIVSGLVIYVLAIRLYLKYSIAIQACMLENSGANASIKRSAFLTQDYLWRIFLIYLLMGVIGLALSLVLHTPAALFRHLFLAVLIWQFLATFAANALSFPISTIATSLLYYDLRVRKEALDLQLMLEAVGQEPLATGAATPVG